MRMRFPGSLLRVWGLSLLLSLLLVLAGRLWPQSLSPRPLLVALPALLPPAVVMLLLWRRWRLP
jgi:hypothetical protein